MRGLLDRIGAEQPAQRPRVIESVVANLQAILNTNQGDGYTCPDLGVDFVELLARWPASEHDVLRAVRSSIDAYEPRLKHVHVRRLPDSAEGVTVLFEISGELAGRGRISLKTELRHSGRVRVQ